MRNAESVQQFYDRTHLPQPGIFTNQHGHFNVYERGNFCTGSTPYQRKDFYKISLIIGTGTINYADKGVEINRNALVFSNPMVPYSWEVRSEKQGGYFCLFTEEFINTHDKNNVIYESPLYKPGGNPVYFIDEQQQEFLTALFLKMQEEMASEYMYKYGLLYNYVNIVIHEALKMQPADAYFKQTNASARIASLFIELLERQFPIDSPQHTIKLKAAADYANHLSVHVNHLNRSVKEVTGKTTSEHIAERIAKEARALLRHTNWNISEIGYSLGFEYPAYFNNFFKKQTNSTPRSFRLAVV